MEIANIDGVKIILENPEALPIAKEKWNKILADLSIGSDEYTEIAV